MKIQKDYSLEQLTAESVNVVEISIATINKKPHESSSRTNSPKNMSRRCWRCGVKIPRYPIRPLKEAK